MLAISDDNLFSNRVKTRHYVQIVQTNSKNFQSLCMKYFARDGCSRPILARSRSRSYFKCWTSDVKSAV